MSNVTLNNITSGYNLSKINDNFAKLTSALNSDRLQLSGGGNVLLQDIDMNSFNLLNIGTLNSGSISLNGVPLVIGSVISSVAPNIISTTNLINGAVTDIKISGPITPSKISFQQLGTGAIVSDIQTKARERISVKDFGAVGDGVTDDTLAINNCIAYCQANSKSMYCPAGNYLTDTINYGHPAGTLTNITITGDGSNCTFFVKKSADSTALFTAGTTSGYTGNTRIEGITFKGVADNTTACVELIACDHWTFYDCQFTYALIGVNDLGGVSNRYISCETEYNYTGFYFDTAPSPSTSVSANNISLYGCIIGNSNDAGIHLETFAQINITNCDLEANGITGGIGSSAIYIGNTAGPIGVHIKGCWIENNGTSAAVYIQSGNNVIEDTLFIANSSATYDLYIAGGLYTLRNVVFGTLKTNNVYETSGVSSGNAWYNCSVPGFTIDFTKTSIFNLNKIHIRGSEVPVVSNTSSPLIQGGVATPTSGGAITVTFPTAYSVVPSCVVASVIDADATKVDSVQVSSITTTGFNAQVTQYNGTSITTPNNSFSWVSIGQG